MKVSVVIPVLNQLELTKLCLDSIEKFTEDIEYEVIVVDNGSNDGTPEYLAGKNVINIRNPENIGVAKAWND
jgi:glycosyltransferase involved in cell wall biosynthesis